MKRLHPRMFLFALVLAAHAVRAAAQDSDPAQLEPLQVTAGRSLQDSAAVPQALSLVDRDQIARQAPRVVTDLLRGQTGVFLQSSGPGQGVIIVRGLKGSELLHLVDGMRLNMTFFRNSPSQYIALVDPYNVDRIEVLRGPASTLYGSDALGGVVQFLTPEHRFGGAGWELDGGALAQYGSGELSRSARTWLAAGNEDVSLSGGFTLTGAGGVDTGGGPRLPEAQTGYVARGYDGKLLWTPAAGHELMLSGQFFEYPELPRFFEIAVQPNNTPAGVPQRTEALFKPNDRRFLHARYRLMAATPIADSVELHLGRQVVNDNRSVIPQRPDQTAERRELEQNRSTLSGLTAQAVRALNDDLRLVYGGEFYSDQVDSAKQCQPLAGSCNAAATAPVFPDGARQDSAGVFVTTEWHAAARWLLDGGLRYSSVRTDLTATPLSAAQRLADADLTGHLGSSVTLRRGLNWTMNFARGFRAPNLFDLGTLGPRGGSNQINVPNPGLEPETLESVDSGFKWNSRGLRAEWVAFYTRYHDRIEAREPTGNTIAEGEFGCSSAGGCPEVRSENISEACYWGWEAGAAWDASTALNLSATLNFTRGTERRAGAPETPANRVPPLNGRVGALWRHAAFSIEPFALFAGEQRRLDADDQADTRIAPGGTPGWATVNLRLGWTPLPQWRLQLEGQNLLDSHYREHGSGIDATGRSVALTAELRFN